MLTAVFGKADGGGADDLPEEYRLAKKDGNPFGLFTLTMTEGTIAAGRMFDTDVVIYTSDHAAGRLAAIALAAPALEVGNRVSWSMRDEQFRADHDTTGADEINRLLRQARHRRRRPGTGGPDRPAGTEHGWAVRRRAGPARRRPVVVDAFRALQRRRGGSRVGFAPPTAASGVRHHGHRRADHDRCQQPVGGHVRARGDGCGGDPRCGQGGPVRTRRTAGQCAFGGFLPLSTILATCSLIVHHGGSGSTAAPLHYGIPQLVMPSFADNFLSAQRVVERGVGLSLDPTTVDGATVRASIERLLAEPAFTAAALEVSAEMATQPSPTAVIERLTRKLPRLARPQRTCTAQNGAGGDVGTGRIPPAGKPR